MPWMETCSMQQRIEFIQAVLHSQRSFSDLCERFGISRVTGYKWLHRFEVEGLGGLSDRSRARHTQAHCTPHRIQDLIVACKKDHQWWGPRPVMDHLRRTKPDERWPSDSTAGEILKRNNLVEPRKPRQRVPPFSQPLSHAIEPNDVWSIDFKGQREMGNGRLCYPLTISDNTSRYLLACKGMYAIYLPPVKACCERVFREYGLPRAIRHDNGYPFASTGLGGLTQLSVWLIKLEVLPERIEPGKPQQNPRHERMHRTLESAAFNPPRAHMAAQQRAFDQFRQEYNELRSHRALKRQTPASCHEPSSRLFPSKPPKIKYPDHFLVRKVRPSGEIKWRGQSIYATQQLAGEHIGLEPMDNNLYRFYFGILALGILDERTNKIIRPKKRS